MRKRFLLVLACALVATLAAASTGLGADKKGSAPTAAHANKKIVLVTYWLDQYGQALAAWSQRWRRRTTSTSRSPTARATRSLSAALVDNAIAAGVDGILWQPIATDAAGPEVKKIAKAKIPVVIFGSALDPKKTGVTVPAVVVNDYKATYKAGQNAAKYVTKRWRTSRRRSSRSTPRQSRSASSGSRASSPASSRCARTRRSCSATT